MSIFGMLIAIGSYVLFAAAIAYTAYWVIRKGVKAGIMDAREQEEAAYSTGEDA